MSQATFIALFMVVWLFLLAYVLSVLKFALRVRHLKRQGRAQDAPAILVMPVEGVRGVFWMLTGRYASLGDDVVTRWSGIARVLFFVALPMMLAVFAIVASGIVAGRRRALAQEKK